MLGHGHSVESVCRLHRASSVSDNNELRAVGISLYVLGKSRDVDLVERRLDLVEDAEGGGGDLNYCKEERDGDKRLLAARKLHQRFDDLSGRCRLYLDSRAENVLGVGERKLCRAAAEELRENTVEVFVDLSEGIEEGGLHLVVDPRENILKVGLGFVEISDLLCHIIVSRLDLLVFLNGVKVNVSDGTELISALRLYLLYLAAVLLCYRGVAEGYCLVPRDTVLVGQLAGKLILSIAQVFKLGFVFGVFAEDELLFVHLCADL